MPVRSLQTKSHDDSEKETGQVSASKTEISTRDKTLQLVKPLVVTMTLFGLMCLNSKNSKWVHVTRIYSVVVLLIFWVGAVQLFFTYRSTEFGIHAIMTMVFHIWYFHCCVNAMVTFRACNGKCRFDRFLFEWSRLLKTNRGICIDNPCIILKKYEREVKRKSSVVLGVTWLVLIINSAWNTYFVFETPMLDFTIGPMSPNHRHAFWVKVIVNCAHLYRGTAWLFPAALFIMMVGIIYKEYEVFHTDLRKAISPEGEVVGLERFRRRHQEICRMVEAADDILSGFNAGGIVFSTLNGMLILYSMVYSPAVRSYPMVLIAHCFWLVEILAYLIFIAYLGGYLNHMAHTPLKTIHSVKVENTSMEFSLQMNMFLNKLSGESIGLTALGMFVIDKPTILTIIGLFITYFIVLIQFQQPFPSSHGVSTCNCTNFFINSTFQCTANYLD